MADHSMKADARPFPLTDPLDDHDEDGQPVVEEDEPEPKKPASKRRKKKRSADISYPTGIN